MRRTIPWLLVSTIAVVGVFLARADSADDGPTARLTEHRTWILRRLTVGGVERSPKQGERATLAFEKRTFRGNAGCNAISGTYAAKGGGAFLLREYQATEMACEHMALELAFLQVLDRIDRFEVRGGKLILSDAAGDNQLEFVPFEPRHRPLAGTQWTLTHFTESDDAVESATVPLEKHPITLAIVEGRHEGTAGCNRYRGTVALPQEGRLRFGELAGTKRACPRNVMQQERRFLDALAGTTTFTIDEDVLRLSNDEGTIGLQFRAAKAD